MSGAIHAAAFPSPDVGKAVVIYGKEGWPYTSEAREAYSSKGYTVDYRNVKKSDRDLDEMLAHSKGVRKVPVIVEAGRVTIGYGGTWGV